MNILFLPNNISSISTSSVEAINRIPGNSAKGFYVNKYAHQHIGGSDNFYFIGISRRKRPIKWILEEFKRHFIFRKLVKWADVIHWVYDDIGLKKSEIRFLLRANKPSVIEWVGSDIRNPSLLAELNPYYKHAYSNGYEYANYESPIQSTNNQEKFKGYKAIPLVNPEMALFLKKNLFPESYFVSPRMLLDNYEPQYPSIENKRPLVVHSPTAKVAKGSEFIISVVEELQRELDFDFKLLHQMPRAEVMKVVSRCDIFIDQIILGMYGLASCEAMCYGKPVMCYLMPAVLRNGLPEDCPIVNTSVETIKKNLKELLVDSSLRNNIGKKSRAYAECYFDSRKNARQLLDIYNKVIMKTEECEPNKTTS